MKIKNRVFLKVMLFLYFIFSACISALVAHPCATEFKIDTVEKDGVGSIQLTPTNPNVSVIQPQFDRAGKFSGDLAPVKMGNKWGFIDYTGTFVIPLQFEDAHSFSEGLAAVKVGGKWGYVDKTGKIAIRLRFNDADSFSEDLAVVEIKGEEYGYINKSGKIVIRPQFENVYSYSLGSFSKGFAEVRVSYFIRVRTFYINKLGERQIPGFIPPNHYELEKIVVFRNENKWGFFSTKGEPEIISPHFDAAHSPTDGLAPVRVENKWGYIDFTKCLEGGDISEK
ncbi:WG repeat-containing protein [Leptospira interrogans]|uniref:WG repeat-containing protein n=1 Tax=Leptospira interrogans TaxID=173 RepID=A0AAV9FR72_LEPIR|nr:WG repeat-containing protein [Leptospira interrogans]KAK2618119.1 WG repeat-containing protein [Leptospira interrogans]UML84662.1 WG repeat-containing protein [Leptospira interrogans]UMQ53810.1 WG repeat-containing protein [Leptospira interrogans]UNE67570.1 WG repeat-containing protein [Leptospira interrogans]